MKEEKRIWIRRAVFCVAAIVVVCGGGMIWFDRSFYPSRSQFEEIRSGMTYDQVTDSLGGLHDEFRPGDYSKTDRIFRKRDAGGEATRLVRFRISKSRDSGWIMFNAKDKVMEAWFGGLEL